MKKLAPALTALAITAFAATAPALAADHVNSLDLTATQVKQLVQDQGRVVLDTGAGHYDLFVANGSFCDVGEYAERAYAPTANSNASFVGYTCESTDDRS